MHVDRTTVVRPASALVELEESPYRLSSGPGGPYSASKAQIERKYFPAIDGLRFLCVMLVIAEHLSGASGVFAQMPLWLGVDVFFLISGFIITTLLLREEAETGKIDIWAFYVRRFFRIVPVYGLILAGYFATAAFNSQRWHFMTHYSLYFFTFCAEFIKFLSYNPSYQPPFGSTWTLGVEEKFYLLFPLLYFVAAPRNWRPSIIPGLLIVLAPLLLSHNAAFWLYRSYFGLLLGCTLALLLSGSRIPYLKALITRAPAIVPLLLVIATALLVRYDWRFVFLFDAAGASLLASLLLTETWLTGVLSTRLFVWLGRRSYSMYLVHTFSLDIIEHLFRARSLLTALASVLLATGIAAAIAGLLYLYVEEPSRMYGKRLLKQHHRTASSISPAAGGAQAK